MTKRILSVLLALVLVLGLSTVALAATINVNNAVDGQTYTAYKMFDITANGDAVAYTVADGWDAFFAEGAAGRNYVTIDNVGNVSAIDGADFAQFAKDALAFAKANGIAGNSADAASGTASITVPTAGYYVVDSSVGALVMMDTNKGEMTIKEKNSTSDSEKEIVNSNVDNKENNVNIGDTVNYKVTIEAKKGTDSLKLVDTMDAGLDFDETSVEVKVGDTALVAGTDYDVVTDTDATFEVVFKADFLPLAEDKTIVVTYDAVVTPDAACDTALENDAQLKFGDNYELESTVDTTKTFTFDIPVFKYTGSDIALPDAEFEIAFEGKTLKFDANGSTYTYNENGTTSTLVSGSDGKFVVKGVKAGTYTLTETQAPAGYNLLTSPITVVVENDGTVKVDGSATPTVNVLNNAGTTLPSTGGIGTTLFYVIGGLLMAFAVVLLVAKKRTVNE